MQQATAQTLSILVVEDDEAVAELVRAVLNDVVGWGTTVVHNAAAAREVFATSASKYLCSTSTCQGSQALSC